MVKKLLILNPTKKNILFFDIFVSNNGCAFFLNHVYLLIKNSSNFILSNAIL